MPYKLKRTSSGKSSGESPVESAWSKLKSPLLETAKEVCGLSSKHAWRKRLSADLPTSTSYDVFIRYIIINTPVRVVFIKYAPQYFICKAGLKINGVSKFKKKFIAIQSVLRHAWREVILPKVFSSHESFLHFLALEYSIPFFFYLPYTMSTVIPKFPRALLWPCSRLSR